MVEPSAGGDQSLVSWQSVFWALVPLAINAMTQPCGRVCGLDPKMRTYLRSSPIFCGIDTMTIIIRFVIFLLIGARPLRAAKEVVIARFDDIDDELEGLQSVEKLTFVRWILFLVTLVQALKLFALSGIPWSQAWGYLFMVSFVIVETVMLLGHAHGSLETSTVAQPPHGTDNLEYLRSYMQKLDGASALLAAVLHFCLFAWAIWRICAFPMMESDDETTWDIMLIGVPTYLFLGTLWSVSFSLAMVGFFALAVRVWLKRIVMEGPEWNNLKCLSMLFLLRAGLSIILVALGCGAVFGGFKALNTLYQSKVVSGWAVSLLWESVLVTLLPSLLYQICMTLVNYNSTLRRQILFSSLEDYPGRPGVSAALVMFVTIVATSVLWYALRYNPTGTFKPAWTDKLG